MTTPTPLPRSTPEAQGIPASAVLGFINALDNNIQSMNSVMLLRHGQVIAEGWWHPYGPNDRHILYSLSKSFTSTAIGLAVDEGHLSVDDLVFSFFPDEAPAKVNEHLAAMKIRHLLSMSTGHKEDTVPQMFENQSQTWVKKFLAQPPLHTPGTHFLYNNGATYMLGAILHKLTGETISNTWNHVCLRLWASPITFGTATPEGLNLGFSGLNITTEISRALDNCICKRGSGRISNLSPQLGLRRLPRAMSLTAMTRRAIGRRVTAINFGGASIMFTGGWGFWAILYCAGTLRGGVSHHQWRKGYASGAEFGVGASFACYADRCSSTIKPKVDSTGLSPRFRRDFVISSGRGFWADLYV